MNASDAAGKKTESMTRIAGLLASALLAGWLFVPAQARSQAQPIQPKAPVPSTATGPSGQGTGAKGTTAKKAPAATRPAYDRALLHPALLKEKAPEQYQVQFVTTRGEFTVSVTRSWAPRGADRFYNLVKHHFYDNASLFRVAPEFVAQFGISSYPAVTAAWQKTEIQDDPVSQSNKKGYITFATAGPNTRTTQVFISLKDNLFLDKSGFAPFGLVNADGMKVVEMFYDQYGDHAGIDQGQIEQQGRAYLDKNFPKLDLIKTATIVLPPPAASTKPAAAAKKP
jgi:peptidyl-prolyl cis-trans isomerase A (cyclophilin A)